MARGCRSNRIPLLEFDNVSVSRDGRRILDSISVTIEEGENLAILGPNGAGKTAFVRTLTREYYPVIDNGPVVFKVRGTETWDVFDIRATLGIVSQDLSLAFNRDIPAREVMLSGFFSSIGLFRHTVTPEMEERVEEIQKFLGISHLADRSMKKVSSGEARRVLIGRALVHNPKTLLLDEPANSLDLSALHTMRSLCRKISRGGTGIILITHNIADIIPEIHRVILMDRGRFVRDGPKEQVLTDEHIRGLFNVPVHVRNEDGYYYATGY